MLDMKVIFKDFNHCKFVVFTALLPMSIILSLRLDGYISWSLWVIFTPLWILKLLVLVGAIVGSCVWCRHPEYRNQRDGYTDFKAMLMTVGMQMLLLMFELLLCNNVENAAPNQWMLVFIPLFFISPVAIAAWMWGFRHDRSLEMELVLSTNILLYIFIALRLDDIIDWSWTAVFIPLWILMCLPGLAVLYYLVWTLLFFSFSFFRRAFPGTDRMAHLIIAFTWILVVVPLLTFEILLCYRLDHINEMSWIKVFSPLYVSLFASLLSSFGSKGGNKWWFAIRDDFFIFLLNKFPSLKIYGNNSYKMRKARSRVSEASQDDQERPSDYLYTTCDMKNEEINISDSTKFGTVVPVVLVENPD